MVSFQCNSCGDVLTKPKLDKHQATCRSSFDCIDCGKRFETPADYKGHTSCISEAEKYHKTLYNGGGGPGRNGRNQQPRQQGGGQRSNHRSQWQQRNVKQATGANDTPLGTPVRMSPVNDTPVVKENTQESRPVAATPKKRKTAPETIESKDTSEPVKKKKKKQNNVEGAPETTKAVEVKPGTKRKSTSEVTVAKRPPQDPSLQIAEEKNAVNEVGGKKKKKKESKVKEDEKGEVKKKEKEKHKKKEDLSSLGQEPNPGAMVDEKVIVAVQGAGVFSVIDEAQSTKRKSKLEAAATDRSADVPAPIKPPQPTASEVAQGDRKKKRQSGNHHGGDGDGKQVAQWNGSNLKEKRKEKKKKRKSEGQTASVVG